jgi:acyl-CoA thioester hydrolase
MTDVSVTISRRVQWMDTDAAGIWHYSTVLRWAEKAETELHRLLGIVGDTFGVTPRVRVEFEFGKTLCFDDPVELTIGVARLGTSSVEYAVEVRNDGEVAATGRVVTVHVDRATGRPQPWPDALRAMLG